MLDAKHPPHTPVVPDNPVLAPTNPDTPDTPPNPAVFFSGGTPTSPSPEDCDGDYWHALIGDGQAATFTGLTRRGLENYRRKGGGPKYVRISSRCLRYRRIDLKAWADEHLRMSTSDDGSQVASLAQALRGAA